MKLGAGDARRVLLGTVGPAATQAADADALIARLRHIQLDPIDRIGTNADLVAFARTPLSKGQVHQAQGFEHVAKERCLLPADAFPYYRAEAAHRPQWRFTKAMKQVPASVCDDVLAEVAERGPLISRELSDHGRLPPVGSGGWASSGRLGTLALRILTNQCRLVVSGRRGKERVFDLPERALPEVAHLEPEHPFDAWALQERVRAAGLLPVAAGPWWGGIKHLRGLEHDGLITVEVAGRRYLTLPEHLEAEAEDDGVLHILGPLDPLLWSRDLVADAFGFTYVWEVYKPKAKRRWGYYVCPLLYRGQLVGRIEARWVRGQVRVEQTWWEEQRFQEPLDEALVRLSARLGAGG